MLVFMVVQLGAAGGTYPLDMAPHFYTVLHKYMPFSYTVHAFNNISPKQINDINAIDAKTAIPNVFPT